LHRSPELMLVCVNTTRAWRHKHGEISGRQVDRMARIPAGTESAQLRVVVVHGTACTTTFCGFVFS